MPRITAREGTEGRNRLLTCATHCPSSKRRTAPAPNGSRSTIPVIKEILDGVESYKGDIPQ